MSQPFQDVGQDSQILQITLPTPQGRIRAAQSCHILSPGPSHGWSSADWMPKILTAASSASAGQHPPNRASAETWVSFLVSCPGLIMSIPRASQPSSCKQGLRAKMVSHTQFMAVYLFSEWCGVADDRIGLLIKTEPQMMSTYRLSTTECLHPAVALDILDPLRSHTLHTETLRTSHICQHSRCHHVVVRPCPRGPRRCPGVS
jgi:hypothetical protein